MSNFASYVSDRTRDFTGREWVFRAINDWLAKTDGSRVFLLTGKPGSGKTAIAGRLTEFSHGLPVPGDLPFLTHNFLSAVYFCSARAALRVDHREFSKSISLQLAECHKVYQRALIAVGEREINISVQQRIERAEAGAETRGVVIENLDISGLNPQEVFNRTVLDPLQMVYEEGFDEPITILVDALDESLVHSGRVTIVELLSGLEDLPSQVNIILTSRRDERVENVFWDAENLFISASAHDERNREDIDAFVRKRLKQEETLAAKTAKFKPADVTGLAKTITDKAQGNFLYVSFLLEALAGGHRSMTDLEGLPEGLDALYYDSLGRVVRIGGRSWSADYAPPLGALSVAQANLSLGQLSAFTGQSEEALWQNLIDLQQFVEDVEPREAPEEESEFRLYHESVIDFLHRKLLILKNRRTPNRYFLSAKEHHQHIVERYRLGADSWEQNDWSRVDNYGLRYLAYHLWRADRKQELYMLLTGSPDWMKHKFAIFADDTHYVDDLELAISDFSDPLTSDEVSTLVKLHTARGVVVERGFGYMDAALHALVWLGRDEEALARARLWNDPQDRLKRLLTVHNALQERGKSNPSVLSEMQQIASSIKGLESWAEVLGNVADALAQAGYDERANALFDEALKAAQAIEDKSLRTTHLIDMAQASAEAEQDEWANVLFDEGLKAAQAIEDKYLRTNTLESAAKALAQSGRFDEALEAAQAIEEDSVSWAEVLASLAEALAQAGHDERANALLDETLEKAQAIEDKNLQIVALAIVVGVVIQSGRFDEALDLIRAQALDSRLFSYGLEDVLPDAAGTLAQMGRFDEALQVSHAADWNTLDGAIALGNVTVALAHTGHDERANALFDEALKAAQAIEDKSIRIVALEGVPGALAQVGRFDEALDAAQAIDEDSFTRVAALMDVVGALAQAGHDERANALFDEALEMDQAHGPTSNFGWKGVLALATLAEALAQTGHDERANVLFDEALKATRITREGLSEDLQKDSWEQALADVAGALTRARRFDKALDAAQAIENTTLREEALRTVAEALAQVGRLDEALEVVQVIEDNVERAVALALVAVALAQLGEDDRANTLLDDALEATQATEEKVVGWPIVLAAVAEALAQAGHSDRANTVFGEALEAAQAIEDHWSRGDALIAVAEALAEVGRFDEALGIAQAVPYLEQDARALVAVVLAQVGRFDEALDVGQSLDWGSYLRAQVLGNVADALAQAGYEERANAVLDEALKVTRAINPWSRGDPLIALTEALAQVGRFDEALETAQSIDWPSGLRANALETVARVSAQSGHFDRALNIVSLSGLDDFLGTLATWAPFLDQLRQGLTITVLRASINVAGWENPAWRKINESLSLIEAAE